MATVERTGSKRHTKRPVPQQEKKSHKLRNFFLFNVLLLVLLAYCAPMIVAFTPLRNWILQTALTPDGSVSVASASLGWFSPISAHNLEVRDPAGQQIVSIEAIQGEKTLVAILLDMDDVGRWHVIRPNAHIVANEKDTNLEKVFARWLASDGQSDLAAAVQVIEGKVVVDDAVSRHKFEIDKLDVDCTLGHAADGIALAASGNLAGQGQPTAFKVDVQAKPSVKSQAAYASGKINCETSALPLELLQPVLRRVVDGAKVSGNLSTQLDGAWGDLAGQNEASVRGSVEVEQLTFAAATLGADEIHLARVSMPCDIQQKGDSVDIKQLGLTCELGQVSVSGSMKTSDFSAPDVLAAIVHETYELKGHLDLARLAEMLPGTLKIREGTQITSGQVDFAASSKHQPSGVSWTGLVETKSLAAQANGRPVVWDKPLSVQFAMRDTKNGIVVDRAVCDSSFLQVNGAGSLDNLSATANFDLARLLTELRQFSNLDHVELAGQGKARLTLKRPAENQFVTDAEFQGRGLQWITAQSRPWKEDNVTARVTVNGQLEGQSLKRVAEATLTLESGSDHLEAQLRQGVDDPLHAPWPLACSWRGQLAPWMPRLESCMDLSGWDVAGAGTLAANVTCSASEVRLESAQVDLAPLDARGPGLFISEPAVSSTATGKWDLAKGRIDIASAKLTAGASTATVTGATLRSLDSGWALDSGAAHVEGDLAQLARWRQDPRTPAALRISGRLTSDAMLKQVDDTISADVNGTIDQLQIADATPPAINSAAKPGVWQERRITMAAQGNYKRTDERLQFDSVKVASDALNVEAKGGLPTGERGGNVDFKGTLAYDWQQLAPLWRPYLGPGFDIAGKENRQFAIHGQLTGSPANPDSWKNVEGEAAAGWSSIDLFGLRGGKADISAKLAGGEVRTQPIDMEISEGRLTMTPVARLSPAPAELTLPAGPLVTNMRLSPELCAQGLRFVAPILANATVAEGRFSISLDGARVPLADPKTADVGGHMAMKGNIKPGPIAAELVGLIKELTTMLKSGGLPNLQGLDGSLISVDNSNIEFRMVNGRVHHRGLTFVVGTTPISTQGSVGLDETVSIVAEIPMQARLLGADLALGGLEGKTLKIPIEGTLSKPKLDKRALLDVPRQVIENAARDVLLDGLNKGLDRLLPGQR